MQRKSKKGKN